MCLLLIAINSHPAYKLVIAANRDEYYDRPTASADFWKDAPDLLAGRDLQAGGTWMGITKKGKIAAVTNYRDPASNKSYVPSRGSLVSNFLLGQTNPEKYVENLIQSSNSYNGFNLIIGEKEQFFWYSNRGGLAQGLSPGIYGLSNHLLDTPWPKVKRSKEALKRLLSTKENLDPEAIFDMLRDTLIADDKSLPNTGVGLEWERILSPIFISSPTYGTRSSTVLLLDRQDRVTFMEKTFNSNPDHAKTVKHEFQIEP